VLAAMEREPTEPWVVRDKLLAKMGWTPDRQSWAAWKAASLNELFLEQGVLGQPGKIRPETIRRTETK